MATAFPGGYNTFVPSFDTTGKLVVAYSRNPKDFAINKWLTLIPVKRSVGYYLKLTAENAARILSSNVSDFLWADGNDTPSGEYNTESFEFKSFTTIRYAFPFRLGHKAIQQADWKVEAQHAAMAAQQAMTGRTINAAQLVLASANWAASHVAATGTALAGAALNTGTATNQILKKALNAIGKKIQKDTLGVVRPKDLCVVLNPDLADALSRSAEIASYLVSSPFALAQVRGDSPSQNGLWGLPDALYGFPIVVEDAVQVAQRKGATAAPAYLFSTSSSPNPLVVVARPGGLVSEGSSAFSTVVQFLFEEMTVETKDDPDNRRTKGRVVEDYATVLASDISGYLVQDSLA